VEKTENPDGTEEVIHRGRWKPPGDTGLFPDAFAAAAEKKIDNDPPAGNADGPLPRKYVVKN
jgi:hypothetical protein